MNQRLSNKITNFCDNPRFNFHFKLEFMRFNYQYRIYIQKKTITIGACIFCEGSIEINKKTKKLIFKNNLKI